MSSVRPASYFGAFCCRSLCPGQLHTCCVAHKRLELVLHLPGVGVDPLRDTVVIGQLWGTGFPLSHSAFQGLNSGCQGCTESRFTCWAILLAQVLETVSHSPGLPWICILLPSSRIIIMCHHSVLTCFVTCKKTLCLLWFYLLLFMCVSVSLSMCTLEFLILLHQPLRVDTIAPPWCNLIAGYHFFLSNFCS